MMWLTMLVRIVCVLIIVAVLIGGSAWLFGDVMGWEDDDDVDGDRR